jgi:hypothetical protein
VCNAEVSGTVPAARAALNPTIQRGTKRLTGTRVQIGWLRRLHLRLRQDVVLNSANGAPRNHWVKIPQPA